MVSFKSAAGADDNLDLINHSKNKSMKRASILITPLYNSQNRNKEIQFYST